MIYVRVLWPAIEPGAMPFIGAPLQSCPCNEKKLSGEMMKTEPEGNVPDLGMAGGEGEAGREVK